MLFCFFFSIDVFNLSWRATVLALFLSVLYFVPLLQLKKSYKKVLVPKSAFIKRAATDSFYSLQVSTDAFSCCMYF